jgi:MerR family transcriptional regulator, thiopeptide resistance regulator
MDTDPEYTVSDLARISGVTVRTLHHYDAIGLLVPSGRTQAGYRLYSSADAARLGRILVYRACGLALADIATVLDEDDPIGHLRRQLALLDARRDELDRQRETLRRALEARIMGINLDPEEILEVFGGHDPTEHAREAQERWGDTDAYRESHRRTSTYSKEDWQRLGAESEEIEAELAACLLAGEPSDGVRACAAAERHRLHIDRWFYPCSYEMHAGLGDMYVADPRFAAHYDERAPGLSSYVRDAIIANGVDRLQ